MKFFHNATAKKTKTPDRLVAIFSLPRNPNFLRTGSQEKSARKRSSVFTPPA